MQKQDMWVAHQETGRFFNVSTYSGYKSFMLEWKKGYYKVYIGFIWWKYMGILKFRYVFNLKDVLKTTVRHDLVCKGILGC